jgi:hypothetical protein
MLLLFLSLYLATALLLLAFCFGSVLIPLRQAKSKSKVAGHQSLYGLYLCAILSGVVGLASRSLYLKYFVEHYIARSERSFSTSSPVIFLLSEVSEYVFGNQVNYFLGIQGYLVLISWSVYMGLEGLMKIFATNRWDCWLTRLPTGRAKRGIPHLWIFLLLTPIVSFACAQALFYLAVDLSSSIETPKKDEHNIFASVIKDPETALLYAYMLGPALPITYNTPIFILFFLAAYTLPVVFIYTWQLFVVAISVNWFAAGGLEVIKGIGWVWVEHPVTKALLYDLALSGAILIYRASSFSDTSSSANVNRSVPEQGDLHPSPTTSALSTALNIAGTGLGATSASVYEAYSSAPLH